MFSFFRDYQLSQSTMVSYAFLPYPSSSCKYKRCERATLDIQHSPWVQSLLAVFMDAIDLLWLLVPVRLGIREANPRIKECRALGIAEGTRPNVQSCVLCSVGPSAKRCLGELARPRHRYTPYSEDRPRGVSTRYDVGLQSPKSLRSLLWSFLRMHRLMECHRTANHNVA